jgi:hypothetical protein
MAKLGSHKKPAVARVGTEARAQEILRICNENGWQVIVGIEPDKPENISDVKFDEQDPVLRFRKEMEGQFKKKREDVAR